MEERGVSSPCLPLRGGILPSPPWRAGREFPHGGDEGLRPPYMAALQFRTKISGQLRRAAIHRGRSPVPPAGEIQMRRRRSASLHSSLFSLHYSLTPFPTNEPPAPAHGPHFIRILLKILLFPVFLNYFPAPSKIFFHTPLTNRSLRCYS